MSVSLTVAPGWARRAATTRSYAVARASRNASALNLGGLSCRACNVRTSTEGRTRRSLRLSITTVASDVETATIAG